MSISVIKTYVSTSDMRKRNMLQLLCQMKEKEVQLKDISIKAINIIVRKEKHVESLIREIQYKRIDWTSERKDIQERINQLK